MNICNNIIKDEEIIGIGPLHWHQKGTSPALCHYSFNVYTKQTAVEVSSEVIEAFNYIDEQDRKTLGEFQAEYFAVRKKIAAMLGEQDPDHQPHQQKINQAFANIETDINELSNRISAMKTPKKSVLMQSVHAVTDNIHHLKTIAIA
jgi:hypothetical protein